jgi:hypothetical protein
MWIMAVCAADSFLIHLALQEGTEHINFIKDLAVRIIKALTQGLHAEVVMKGSSVGPVVTDGSPARVARSTGFHLEARTSVAEINRKTIIGRILNLSLFLLLSPLHVFLARAMASLAAYINLVPGCVVSAGVGVEVLTKISGVALRTHQVPVLIPLGPVEWVIRGDSLVWIKVKPPLVLRVPAHREALESTAGKFNEVLLQRFDTKDIFDSIVSNLTVWPLRVYVERLSFSEEVGSHSKMRKGGVFKISQDRFASGLLHRKVMMRALPRLVLCLVTVPADPAFNELNFSRSQLDLSLLTRTRRADE